MSGSENTNTVKEEQLKLESVKVEENQVSLPNSTGEDLHDEKDDKVMMVDSTLAKSRKKTRSRPRKKKMYMDICQQIEFYFSDANIAKDRMMKDLINASEYVDLKIFFTFNKIQKLIPDGDIVVLQKALANSQQLVLSENLLQVKRKISFDPTKLKSEIEIEKCTIYVENIPAHFDHDKLKKIFQEFGPVAYVAIPKARSGLPKGFAFVEFETEQGVESCLNAYGDIGACLPGNMDPAELLSVKTFEPPPSSSTHTKTVCQDKNKNSTKSDRKRSRPTEEHPEDDEQVEQPRKKGKTTNGENEKRSSSHVIDDDAVVTTTTNNDDDDDIDGDVDSDDDTPDKSEICDIDDGGVNSTTVHPSNSDENPNKSREKKRRRKNYKNKKIESIEQCESESIQLRIMAKKNWKQLRSRYLNVQREHLSKLKHQLRHQRQPQQSQSYSKEKKSREPQQEEQEQTPNHVLVKVTFPQPLTDEEAFKSKVKNEIMPSKWSTSLKYIDCFPNHAIVKIDGQVIEAVSKFIHNASSDFPDVEVLSAAASKEYWDFVRSNLKDDRKKKSRGRDKVVQNAMKTSSHIRFE